MDLKLIDWEGGEMPVEQGTRVLVVHRDGGMYMCPAGHMQAVVWSHHGYDGDILAYMEAPIAVNRIDFWGNDIIDAD